MKKQNKSAFINLLKSKQQLYQEDPKDTWCSNGVHYNINEVFKIAHDREAQTLPIETFRSQVKNSKIEIKGTTICGSCYNQVKDLAVAQSNHDKRVNSVDITIPIIVFKDSGKWRVVDGAHRVEKALNVGVREIPVIVLDEISLSEAKV